MQLCELTARLTDEEALESHLQTEYVRGVLEKGDAHPRISLNYVGSPDLNIGVRDIDPSSFTLDSYVVRNSGMGALGISLRASSSAFVPTVNCEYGPGGHNIELAESRFVYKARVFSGPTDPYVDGVVFVVAVA